MQYIVGVCDGFFNCHSEKAHCFCNCRVLHGQCGDRDGTGRWSWLLNLITLCIRNGDCHLAKFSPSLDAFAYMDKHVTPPVCVTLVNCVCEYRLMRIAHELQYARQNSEVIVCGRKNFLRSFAYFKGIRVIQI